MTTKRQLIAVALEEIGLATYVFDATPEQWESYLRRLNSMAAEWDGSGMRTGFNLGGGLDEESGVPDTVDNCYSMNLAVRIAPTVGKVLSVDTKVGAANALNTLMIQLRQRPEIPYPVTMPIGTGNKRDVLDRQYFGRGDGTVTGLNDGATEY